MPMNAGEIVRRFYDVGVNQRDWSVVEALLAPDFTHNGQVLGIDGQRRSLETLYAAFPDAQVRLDETIVSDDRVVTRMTWTGTQRGLFLGVPPSGAAVTWTAISIIRVTANRIARAWVNEDDLGILRQIGVTVP